MSTLYEKKHQHIVEAAFDLFLKHGFSGTSMDNVAQQAGLSKATLYNHFEDKHVLFHSVMVWHCQNLTNSISFSDYLTQKTLETRLRSFAHSLVAALMKPSSIALMRLVIFETGQFADLGNAIWANGKLPLLDEFIVLIKSEHDAGLLHIKNAPLAARQFFGLIKECIVWPVLMGVTVENSPLHIEEVVEHAVSMFVNYYRR